MTRVNPVRASIFRLTLQHRIKGILRFYLQHSKNIEVRKALGALFNVSSPQIKKVLESQKVDYWYGLLFLRSRRNLKEVYGVLATPPSKAIPARKAAI